MRRSETPPSLLLAICLIAGATLLANFLAAISSAFLSPLFHTQSDWKVMVEVVEYSLGPVIPLTSFLIPSILATIYIFPVYRICYTKELGLTLSLAQRRLLNMPLVLGLIGLSGWLIGALDYFRVMMNQVFSAQMVIAGYVLDSFLTGSLVFVFSYYLLEFISRKYFIPAFFPGGRLSECRGTMVLSIQIRFYILFFAVSIVPMLLMLGILRANSDGSKLPIIATLTGIVLLLGAFLVYLVSRSYQVPLVEMAHAARQVELGNYEIGIDIVSNDEVGKLGEALNEMATELKEKDFIKDTFGKVVDPRVRDHLLNGHIELGGELREATILFTDIRNFTSISAGMRPDQVVDWLNRYFDIMSGCIVEQGGIVNKYVGDAILAVFGVPIHLDNQTAAAVKAAGRMKTARDELNKTLEKAGLPLVQSGISIHTGPVLAGNIGSSSRMEYTVIGDTVNVAARLEKLCKEFGTDIILSESAVLQLGHDFQARDLGWVEVRGKQQPIRIFCPEA